MRHKEVKVGQVYKLAYGALCFYEPEAMVKVLEIGGTSYSGNYYPDWIKVRRLGDSSGHQHVYAYELEGI